MTALLTRLRIAGFKSFAEPASLDILPGLTGIVGPNGCGKSNVVEALRWAMGETSVRSLRGGEMDDVIFAGTSARASRNLAEVTITLQKGEHALPDPFGDEGELQVTRRIERGAGSAYRANGREMRARDVQTLFADMASGAHSSAMVSQGRVSALVNAKPEARRIVLEEAAGITGLHARRHEAELKLRAAESNLGKAEDLRTQLESSRESLRKQARQASRYRNISGLVRAAETEFLSVQHGRAAASLAAAEMAQSAAQAQVAAAEAAAAAAAAAYEAAELALPAPREAEAAARSLLERRRLEAETLAEDAARALRAYEDAAARLAHIEADLEDAGRLEADAVAAATQARAEADAVAAQLEALPLQIASAAAEASAARAALGDAERLADVTAAQAADAAAAARQAAVAEQEAATRLADAEAACDVARQARDAAAASLIDPASLEAARARLGHAEQHLAEQRDAALQADGWRRDAADRAAAAGAAVELAASQARDSDTRYQEAATRAARLGESIAEVEAALLAAERALVPAGRVLAEAAVATAAAERAVAAEAAARQAEQAHLDAGTARLESTRRRDSLRADHARLADAAASAAARRGRLLQEASELADAMEAARAAVVSPDRLAAAHEAEAEAVGAAESAEAALRRLAAARETAERALAESRQAASSAAAAAARLQAEADGLRQALAGADDDTASLIDSLEVPAGLEAALGAVLSGAAGSLDDQAAGFWRELPSLPAPVLPGAARPLAGMIPAPAALNRALSYVGLLAEQRDGFSLQRALLPGCALVSLAGDVWRWDGQVFRGGAPNAAVARLRQRARLRELDAAREDANTRAEMLQTEADDAQAAAGAAAAFEAEARMAQGSAAKALGETHQALAALNAEAARAEERVQALLPAEARSQAERAQADAAYAEACVALSALDDPAMAAADADAAESVASAAGVALAEARTERDTARVAAQSAAARLRDIEQQAAEAESRAAALRPQLARLHADLGEARCALAAAQADRAALPDLAALRAAADETAVALNQAGAALTAARQAETVADAGLREASAEAARLDRAQGEAAHAMGARETVLARDDAARVRALAAFEIAREFAAQLPDPTRLADEAAAARLVLTERRAAQAATASSYAETVQTQAAAQARGPIIAQDMAAWQARAEEAARRRAGLAGRHESAVAEAASLAEAPALLAARAAASGDALAQAEAEHAARSAALQAADQAWRTAGLTLRDADSAFAACRETLARGEGALETAGAALASVLAHAAERLGPDGVLSETESNDEAAEERARRRLERLQRERDEMGPVNLRADLELDEITARIEAIEKDRDELTTAIAKLRGSIGHLNREGRERLTAVFTEVDRHFRTLFTRMMGGGRAHLALTGSDDPLTAGLEIYAEPPGKKLSTLSLLSGGEQALTALSLIFAVFRCTPAPIAVLDEVDAPLDDANVDRFCSLLEDVVRDTGTRFLVVTHHQLTMSRMDRLFGVTMQERGVSRLLSVDLRRAAELVEPALQAAE